MKVHLLSTKQQGRLVSTRWVGEEDGVVYEIPLTGKLDESTLTFELGGMDEVLYIPPYGSSMIEIDLSEARKVESKTKRGDRLVKVVGGTVTIDNVEIKRKQTAVPKLIRSETEAVMA